MRIAFEVEGKPVPQGSMVASYNRRQGVAHVHHVQGAALAMWRSSIREQARAAGAILSPLPISITIVFGVPRPKAHMAIKHGRYVVKMQHYYDRPAVAPDLDKLVRAVHDALSGVCYRDDSQIVDIRAMKIYADKTYIELHDEVGLSLPEGMEKENALRAGEGQLPLPDLL